MGKHHSPVRLKRVEMKGRGKRLGAPYSAADVHSDQDRLR